MFEIIAMAVMKTLINKFATAAYDILRARMLRDGIELKAKIADGHITEGNNQLSAGNLQGWLDELNKENS